jgi:hypothetical protein
MSSGRALSYAIRQNVQPESSCTFLGADGNEERKAHQVLGSHDTSQLYPDRLMVTYRKDGEQLSELLDRAIREYPDRTTQLVFLGWRDAPLGQ